MTWTDRWTDRPVALLLQGGSCLSHPVSAPLPGFARAPSRFSRAFEPKLAAMHHGQIRAVLHGEPEAQVMKGSASLAPSHRAPTSLGAERETPSVTSVTTTTHLVFSSLPSLAFKPWLALLPAAIEEGQTPAFQ